MFDALSIPILSKYASLAGFENEPDVIEEYYYLVSKVLKFCPILFFEGSDSSRLVRTIQGAIQVLSIAHPLPQKAVLDFLENLIAVTTPDASSLHRQPPLPLLVATVSSFLPQFAPVLIENVLQNITGRLPNTALQIERGSGSISNVIWILRLASIMISPTALQVLQS
jgi:hypothetical protein